MTSQIPPHLAHILDIFTRESLLELLEVLSDKIGYQLDNELIHEVSKEDLLLDLSWLFNQVGFEESLEVFVEIMQKQPVIH